MRAQAPVESPAPKAYPRGVEGRAHLVPREHHGTIFPCPHEANVGSLADTAFLLKGVPAEAIALVGLDRSSIFGVNVQDQP